MESSLFFIIFMAIIQGIAEFLPISSSGHLEILGQLFAFDAETNATLNIVLHAGTLLAIIVYYFKELINILKKYDFDLIGKIIIATIPVGVAGIIVKSMAWDESIFNNLFVPGIGFLITATILLWGQESKGNKTLDKLSLTKHFNWSSSSYSCFAGYFSCGFNDFGWFEVRSRESRCCTIFIFASDAGHRRSRTCQNISTLEKQ